MLTKEEFKSAILSRVDSYIGREIDELLEELSVENPSRLEYYYILAELQGLNQRSLLNYTRRSNIISTRLRELESELRVTGTLQNYPVLNLTNSDLIFGSFPTSSCALYDMDTVQFHENKRITR